MTSLNHSSPDLLTTCTDLAALMLQARALSAPYDAQIQSLEVARADALAALTFQIDTLKAVVRPMLLAEGRSVKVDGLTASVVHKQTWDTDLLLAMAEEIPAILQCRKDATYVAFR